MNTGKLVFAQLTAHLPLTTSRRCVARYKEDHKVESFTRIELLQAMIFAHNAFRENLRDIEASVRAPPVKRRHMGLHSQNARSTLANGNALCDGRIYVEFFSSAHRDGTQILRMRIALESNRPIRCTRSTRRPSICVCRWYLRQPAQSTKAAVKLHALLDLRGFTTTFLHIRNGKLHDINVLDQLPPNARASYVVDCGHIEFERLAQFDQADARLVTRATRGMRSMRLAWHKTDRSAGMICDRTIAPTMLCSKQGYSKPLHRVRFKDPETGKKLVFIINHLDLERLTICQLYTMCRQVELCFKWIEQQLRINAFSGTSENATKSQM